MVQRGCIGRFDSCLSDRQLLYLESEAARHEDENEGMSDLGKEQEHGMHITQEYIIGLSS